MQRNVAKFLTKKVPAEVKIEKLIIVGVGAEKPTERCPPPTYRKDRNGGLGTGGDYVRVTAKIF